MTTRRKKCTDGIIRRTKKQTCGYVKVEQTEKITMSVENRDMQGKKKKLGKCDVSGVDGQKS